MTLRQLHAINPNALCSTRLLAWVEYYYDLPRTVQPAITGAARTSDGFVMYSTTDDPLYNRTESADDITRNLHGLLRALSPSNVKPGNAGTMDPDKIRVSPAMQRRLKVDPASRLEYLRQELRAERISYGELSELQSLARHIAPDDVELLEAAGIPEGTA